jgi:hypothetical protein
VFLKKHQKLFRLSEKEDFFVFPIRGIHIKAPCKLVAALAFPFLTSVSNGFCPPPCFPRLPMSGKMAERP